MRCTSKKGIQNGQQTRRDISPKATDSKPTRGKKPARWVPRVTPQHTCHTAGHVRPTCPTLLVCTRPAAPGDVPHTLPQGHARAVPPLTTSAPQSSAAALCMRAKHGEQPKSTQLMRGRATPAHPGRRGRGQQGMSKDTQQRSRPPFTAQGRFGALLPSSFR